MANVTAYDFRARTDNELNWLERARKAISDYRLYRKTLTELQSLSERELADLGISRLSVPELAYESVYRA
jgi:uncharacterized protein YjiS (DUF1127 family)